MARTTTTRRQVKAGRPSADDAATLDQHLLDTAAGLFLAQGYAQTTMEKIARAARASTKTMYSRYSNKSDVLAAVIKRLVERTLQSEAFTPEGPAGEARAALLEVGLRFASLAAAPQTTEINRLVIAEASRFPELIAAYSEGPERARRTVEATLLQLEAAGKLRLAHAADVSATLFFDMATSTPRMRSLLGSPMTPEAMAAHVAAAVDVFLKGNPGR